MSNLRTKLAEWLISSAKWLKKGPDADLREPRFVDLAPTDQADEGGVYSGALTEATNNPRVMNIALTGPYGSGKSSIIKSFLKSYDRDVLQISLAAFLPDAVPSAGEDGGQEIKRTALTVSRQEIERSILQQMLYGADANKLPLSRFAGLDGFPPFSAEQSPTIALAAWTQAGNLAFLFRQSGSAERSQPAFRRRIPRATFRGDIATPAPTKACRRGMARRGRRRNHPHSARAGGAVPPARKGQSDYELNRSRLLRGQRHPCGLPAMGACGIHPSIDRCRIARACLCQGPHVAGRDSALAWVR